MDTDDLEPQVAKPKPLKLEEMSIGELEERIAELEAEIALIRETIEQKRAAQGEAEAVFKL